MSECKCDLRTKLVGDGCRYCNPQEYIDNLIESLEEQRTWVNATTWRGLTDVEIDQGLVRTNYAMQTAGAWRDGVEWAVKQLQERNT